MTNQSIASIAHLNEQEVRRLLVQHLTEKKLGLTWEHNAIERDKALNAHIVLPRLVAEHSHGGPAGYYDNLVIEGDNFDSLRLLKSTHAGKVRVILIDPPYNTGNKDWVYNDHYVGVNDRWRHSQWLEFLYQRLTLARDLLTSDGVIMVCINDDNHAKLELLMEEVFPGGRLGSFAWKTRSGSNDEKALFSVDHEYILVFANPAFKFRGEDKDFSQYKNPDKDSRGPWKTGDLGCGKTYIERPNTYYPIQNPKTKVWYPCNPMVVWRFASESRVDDISTLRAKTMEQYIREDKVIFPDSETERVEIWRSKEDLLRAIEAGDVPVRPKSKTPLLTKDLPDLEFWINKPVGFGRPWFKRHLRDVQSDLRPISSWIRGAVESEEDDAWVLSLAAQRSGTGELSVNEILGKNAFSYPKPVSLIQGLLAQATNPGDIVLDFFAGSGTTAHAVLALNEQDDGKRKFIMCSSTESTVKEPEKNICLNVCAERIRRVIERDGLGANFAYLQLDKLDPADARLDASFENARQLLAMRFGQCALAPSTRTVEVLGVNDGVAYVILSQVNAQSIQDLIALPYDSLAVYSHRPSTVAEQLVSSHKKGNCYSIADAIALGQAGGEA